MLVNVEDTEKMTNFFGKYVGLGGNNLTIMLKTNTLF